MYLSKLKIFGFKSFAQKVEVNFPGNGITSVVGPNGCGKSNIVDAIRWVLGEQRAKQLRSSNMQDVIFSGTADKPAMNVAEVSLIINNDKGLLPSEYSEIQITRRVSRSGESTYMINNQECRLRDIQNLFFDTGMGAASYSLMEQRMIDAILSDKAEDRRQLFEEASGISKYKQQRRDSLRQLEKTAQDLIRVEDNLNHVRKSLANYERQAKKMEEWKIIRDRLKALEVSMAHAEYTQAKEVYKRFENLGVDAKKESDDLDAKISLIEAQLEERKLAMSEEEDLYKELDQEVISQQMDIRTLEGEINSAKERLNLIEENRRKAEEEILHLQEKIEDLESDKSQSNEVLAEEEQNLVDLEKSVEELTESRQTLKNQYEDQRDQYSKRSAQRIRLVEAIASEKQKFEKQLNQKNYYEQRISQIEEEREENQSQFSVYSEELKTKEIEVEELEAEQAKLEERSDSSKEAFEVLQNRRVQLEEEGHGLKETHVGISSRIDVLEKMINSGEGLAEGVRYLKEHASDQIKGLLSDFIEVPPEYSEIIELCLGESLQTLSVDNAQDAKSLLDNLAQSAKGRAWVTFNSNSNPVNEISIPQKSGVIASLSSMINDGEFSNRLKWLLKDFILVESSEVAMNCAQDNSCAEAWYVTLDGTMWHSQGLVKGGVANQGPSVLKQKSELETLQVEFKEAEEKLQDKRAQYEECREELQNFSESQKDVETQLAQYRNELQTTRQLYFTLQAKVDGYEVSFEKMDLEKEKAFAGISEIEHFLSNEGQTLTGLEAEREKVEEGFDELEADYRESEENWQIVEEEYKESYNSLVETRNTLNQNRQKLDFIDRQAAELQGQIERRRIEKEQGVEVIDNVEAQIEEVESKIEIENEALAVKEGARDEAKAVYDAKVGELEGQRTELKELNTKKYQLQEDTHKSMLQVTEVSGRMAQIKERIYERYEVNIDAEELNIELVEFVDAEAKLEIEDLLARLQKIGNVNPSAMEDYEEEKERSLSVEKQYKDLDKARISLDKTIRRLDELARKRFLETFDQIRKNFQDVFDSVMRGGKAKLTLEEGVDPLEARIEINAQPTGKKMRGVALLSGGERALTATSLLFALYMVKPSPYCILDEVDGPLDDANIGRFVKLLRRFSIQTQFIVVTHNKRTMAASDRLYGVTQEVKGISRIAVVKLDEAASMVG